MDWEDGKPSSLLKGKHMPVTPDEIGVDFFSATDSLLIKAMHEEIDDKIKHANPNDKEFVFRSSQFSGSIEKWLLNKDAGFIRLALEEYKKNGWYVDIEVKDDYRNQKYVEITLNGNC